MIDDLDEALRRLLRRELPIKNGEVEVDFHQPKRDWSARLSRPTLNLFLYDVRENTRLRQAQPMWQNEREANGTIVQRLKPVRVDLRYLLTVWATEPEDEHRLLSRTLMALFLNPQLPDDVLPDGLRGQPVPISLMSGQANDLPNPSDMWSAMDNEIRPAVPIVVTLALDPYQPLIISPVRSLGVRLGQSEEPWTRRLTAPAPDLVWTIGGRLITTEPTDNIRLTVVERGLDLDLQPEGRFTLGPVQAGTYTIEVAIEGREPRRYEIAVPSADYVLEA